MEPQPTETSTERCEEKDDIIVCDKATSDQDSPFVGLEFIWDNGLVPVVSERTPKRLTCDGKKTAPALLHKVNWREELPSPIRATPLPLLSWGDSDVVWQNMVYKEGAVLHLRRCRLFEDPSSFLPRKRAIVLDWMMEVCEVFHLRRVTYYLALDYLDRYLTINPEVPKNQMQLVGVTCLFMAAKMEEIYPPKLHVFSHICDGACTNNEIVLCEVHLLNILDWDLNQMTPTGWLNLYMQIHHDSESVRHQRMHQNINWNFMFPRYSVFQFVTASHLIDLFSLDPGFLLFSYSVIAASAMYFFFGKQVAQRVSGLIWAQFKHCVEYMTVIYKVVRDATDPKLQSIPELQENYGRTASFQAARTSVPDIISDENQSFQTHVIDLDYFEKATLLRFEQLGFEAHKDCFNQQKNEQGNCDNGDIALVMFDIKKVSNRGISCESVIDTSSKVTFDEIIRAIYNCTMNDLF